MGPGSAQGELLLPSSWQARPQGFVALMQLYESNYLRLRQLCGEPAHLAGQRLSQVGRGCALRMQVLERSAYTVTLHLTHLFDGAQGLPAGPVQLSTYPDVVLVVYCDARLVQAREWAEVPPVAGGGERELHRRWAYNIMLNKWLEYCLELGHRLA
jgi:uncharacterized protein YqiB (DUF1249 family)